MREAPGGDGDRPEDRQFAEHGPDVDVEGPPRERVAAFGRQEDVPAGDVPAVAERPEGFETEWRAAILAEPIEEDVRRLRRADHQRDLPMRAAGDPPCHAGGENEGEHRDADAVGGGPVERVVHEVEVGKDGGGDAGNGQWREAAQPTG
jgi:hypothetical protein